MTGLLQILATGLGAGAFGRSVMGASDFINAPTVDPLSHSSSVPTPLPVIVHQPKKKKVPLLPAAAPTLKMAQQAVPALAPAPATPKPQMDAFQRAANILPDNVANPAVKWHESTWGMPLAVGTGIGGVYGGWKLVDWLLKNRRQNDLDSQVSDAEKEYQNALAAQYRSAMQAKNAGDDLGIDSLYDALCRTADGREKRADGLLGGIHDTMMWPWRKLLGDANVEKLQGLLTTTSLIGGLGTGLATYNYAKSRNQQKLLDKAIQMRARQRQFSPTPFYAVPESREVVE